MFFLFSFDFNFRLLSLRSHPSSGSFASAYHTYAVDWNENGIDFILDGKIIESISPPDGFWNYGEFDTVAPGSDNPWQYTENKMTPFDQEVCKI